MTDDVSVARPSADIFSANDVGDGVTGAAVLDERIYIVGSVVFVNN